MTVMQSRRPFTALKPRLGFHASCVVGIALYLPFVVAAAQPLTACPTCKVERTLVAVLGADHDREFPAEIGAFPLRLSDGRTVVRGSEQAQLLMFDARGTFVRAIARRGGGPGELHRVITAEVSAGDTLFVHQPGGITAFSRSGAFLRQVPVDNAGISGMLHLPSGRFVVSMPMASDGVTLGSLSANGRVLKGFDAANDESSCLPCKTRRLARSNRVNQFFAVPWSNYAIETWTEDGTLLRRVQMNRSWFPPNAGAFRASGGPAPPQVVALSADAAGRLWLGGYATNDRWRAKPFDGAMIGGSRVIRPQAAAAQFDVSEFDAFVDVVNPENGALLASAHFPGEFLLGLRDNTLYTQKDDAEGNRRIHMWKLSIVR